MLDTIQLKVKNVRKAYKDANQDGKKLIENLCGDEGKGFLSVSLLDRLQSIEACFAEVEATPVPEFECVPEKYRQTMKDYYTAVVVVDAHNEGERVDVYSGKPRHYPYYEHNGSPAAFRFYGTVFDSTIALAGGGSRLSVRDAKTAETMGRRFAEVFRNLITR